MPMILYGAVMDLRGKGMSISLLGDAVDTDIKVLKRTVEYDESLTRFYDEVPLSARGMCLAAAAKRTQGDLIQSPKVVMELGLPEEDALAVLTQPTHSMTRCHSLRALGGGGRKQAVVAAIAAAGGIEAVLAAMRAHGGAAGVQEQGIYALWYLAHESPSNKQAMRTTDAVEDATAAEPAFAGHADIQQYSAALPGMLT